MKYSEKVLTRLNSFFASNKDIELPVRFREVIDGVETEIQIQDRDKFTLLLNGVRLAPENLYLEPDRLNDAAKAFVPVLSKYLVDIEVVEVDKTHEKAQLKSHPEYADDSEKSYFEIYLSSRGVLNIQKVSFNKETREINTISFPMTLDILKAFHEEIREQYRQL